jgi:hypothetical protein
MGYIERERERENERAGGIGAARFVLTTTEELVVVR